MWFDPQSNLVVYDQPPPRFTELVKGARTLHNGYVAAPASLYNLQVIRYLDQPVPPIMAYQYDWPRDIKTIPKPFKSQLITANFLALHPRSFCLSDMGTGKTLATLWAADFVMQQYPKGACRCLIVAPLSTLQRVWSDAIFQNLLGRRRAVVLHGSAKKRKDLLAHEFDFYIINYDGLAVVRQELVNRADIRMVIVDEASAYRDRGTARHRLGRMLYKDKDYLWLLTGTPTPNAPTDAWGLAKVTNNAHGESYNNFHARTMYQISKWKWMPRVGAHVMAHKLLQPSIRFAIADCIDLPPCTVQLRDVELSSAQAKAYKELKRSAVLQTKQGPITAANEAVLRMKLIQISAGAVYATGNQAQSHSGGNGSGDTSVHFVDCGPRLAALREVMEQCNEKIIIFAPLTSVIHMLHSELKKDYSCEVINGEVGQAKRNEVFRAFQGSEYPRVIIADPGTMAHGLTLTAASTIVWFAPTDRTELYLQANKRIDRPGQVHNTSIVQLASTPIEREIYRRLAANESLMGLTLLLARDQES